MLNLYTIFDKVSNAHQNPIYQVNKGAALRIFQEAVNDPETYLNKAPHDYILYELGTFNPQTGLLETHEPERIVTGNEVLDPSRNHLAKDQISELTNLVTQLNTKMDKFIS